MKILAIWVVAVIATAASARLTAQSNAAASKSEIQNEIANVRASLKKSPQSAYLHNQLAALYAAVPDLTMAQEEIRIAVRLDPANPLHYVQAASLYRRTGDRREIGVLKEASRLDPNNPLIAFMLGQYKERKGELVEARAEFTRAQELLDKAEARGVQLTQTKAILPARIVNDVYYDSHDNAYTVKNLRRQIESSLERTRKRPT